MKLITLFLLCALTLFAEDFSVIIHKPYNAALFDITEDYDRTISAVGFCNNFHITKNSHKVYHSPFDYLAEQSDRYGVEMSLVKVDNNAHILLDKVAKLSKFNKAVSIKKTPTNGYFIGGYTMDGSLIVAQLNSSGNILKTNIFGTKNFDRMENLLLLSDGGILAIGSSITSRNTHDDMFTTGLGNNDIYITRFDKNLHMLWSKKYGTSYDDVGIDAAEAFDGSILVVSTTSYKKHREVSLMRLSENGDRIWLKHYKSQNLVIPKRLIRLRDNNFLVLLSQYNELQKEHIRLIKFDLYENILLDKEILTTYPSTLNDIAEFSNGTLVGVGYVKDLYNTDGLAMLIDSTLSLLKQEHYGDQNYDIFHALTILNNSQIAIAGVHTDPDAQEQNMWITKLNKDLTLASVTSYKSEYNNTKISKDMHQIYKALTKLFANEIATHTLHITPDLSITLEDQSLYFQIGKYTLTPQQKKFLHTFSNKLFPFLQHHKNSIAMLEVNGHTSSEWNHTHLPTRYLKNEKLSLQRAYSVIEYIFTHQNHAMQQQLSKWLKGSGRGYGDAILSHHKEDREKSRRVSFKIILR